VSVSDDKALKSPLMGVVQAIECAPGDSVTTEQPLLVLEAMKMLTTIASPSDATIKAIHVGIGDSVKQGQVLVEFE
jgi:biotin carboxyl carrier protein